MASNPFVSLSTAQGSPSFSSSFTGSFPIRAPITLDDDYSDFESNGHITDNAAYSDTSSSVDNGSESEEYVSGEEFESASEKLFLGDPDEEIPDESEVFSKYQVSRPFVADPDEESLGNSESGVTDEYNTVIESDDPNLPRIMPIAQLSMDDDEFDELMSDEDLVSGDGNDGRSSGPGFGVLGRMDSAPRVKMSDSDVEEDKEVELLVQRDSSVVNESELLPKGDDEDLILAKFVGVDNGVFDSEDDKFAVKDPPNDSSSVELIEDDSHIVTSEAHLEPLVDDIENFEVKEDVKNVVNDSVSIESVEDDGHVVQESHIESSVESKENVLETGSQLDDDAKHAKHFVEERLLFDEKSMGNGLMNHVSEQCSASPVKEQIVEVVNGCGDAYESELNLVDNIVAGLQDLKVDEAVLLKEQMTDSSYNTSELVIKSVDESVQKVVPEPEVLKVTVVGVEAENATDFEKNDESCVIAGSVHLEKGSDYEKLEDKTWPETEMTFESLAPEDAIGVESLDNASEMNEIQIVDLLVKGDLPEMSGGDRLEEALQSNTNFLGIKDKVKLDPENTGGQKRLLSDEGIEDMIFGGSEGSETNEHIMNELEKSSSSSPLPADDFYDHPQIIDGQIVSDSDGELETDKDREEKKLFDSAALTALLKAAAGAKLDGDSITLTSADGSKVFSFERPAGLGSSFDTMGHALQSDMVKDVVNDNISEEEKKMIEKIQHIRVKFLRLVQRLGHSPEDSIVAQVLHRLFLAARGHISQEFSLESAKRMALQLEAEGKNDLDFCLNVLVIGKTGVGKSATINSIFGEKKVVINAFEPATTRVKEIVGTIDGVRIRILDTPGLRCPGKEQATNRKILASIKKLTKKFPPDVVLYVDRLDTHARDLNDLPLLVSLTNALTVSIWRNAIVTLTHASAPPPDGPFGSPLSFDMFAAQRSRVVQQAISQATGDLRLMHPSMMHPVSLVENHPSSQKNKEGESVLSNGPSWRPQLLLLCYSLKILSEVSSVTKPPDPFDHNKHFGSKLGPQYLSHLVSSLLQSCPHPKLSAEQGGDDVDSDVELLDFSDSDEEDEDEYDRLPPFKPLKRSQVNKLSKEQRKAYFEEYDYRVKLLQKKQWREEVKRLKELKKKSKDSRSDDGYTGEDVEQEDESPAAVPVPLPEFLLPPSFDSDNPTYRYRMLEPTSQLLVRPVLESQGWDHDCGYDGVSLERNLAVAGRFPGAFSVQISKDKKEFNIHLDSSICAKHRENGSTMAGFNIQTFGRQLAYVLRSETKFKNFKINKTAAGICITLLGKNAATGLKIEDQITVGKRLSLVGSAGAVRSGDDTVYGANFEVHLKSKDFPVEQNQTTLALSVLNSRTNLGVMANLQSQFSIGRNSKMAINIGMNKKQSGQITIKTSSSELQLALLSVVPMVLSILRSVCSGSAAKKSNKLNY